MRFISFKAVSHPHDEVWVDPKLVTSLTRYEGMQWAGCGIQFIGGGWTCVQGTVEETRKKLEQRK